MAATADSNPLPTSINTNTVSKTASPPWIQVVRGPEPEPIVLTPSSEKAVVASDNSAETGGDSNVTAAAAASKKPAWNKKPITVATSSSLMNGGPVESGGATVVMGAELWPSLSDCTKASPKVSSGSDLSNNLTDVGSSLSPHQVTGVDTSSMTTISSVRSPSSTAPKPTTSYSNHHLTSNHGQPARQKSMKREGEGSSQANGVFSHQSSQPAGEGSHHTPNRASPKPISIGSSEHSGRDNVQTHNHREAGQRNANGEHPHHRNSYRRGNGGPQSRGDGSHQTHGGRRRDQERGNHDWNHQHSFNGRDASLQPSVVSRGFARPHPVSTPFVHHPHVQPYLNPAMPDLPIFYLPAGMQFVAPVPPMYFSAPDPELSYEIKKQIDFYFSNDNLVRDTFLRERMDENGWVSVDLISKFNRVKNLTNDTFQILEAIRPSSVVEVQGDKIRKRDDWMRWIMPPSVMFPTSSDSQSPKGPAVSAVTDHIQSVSLDERTNDSNIMEDQASSGDSKSAPQTAVDDVSPGGC